MEAKPNYGICVPNKTVYLILCSCTLWYACVCVPRHSMKRVDLKKVLSHVCLLLHAFLRMTIRLICTYRLNSQGKKECSFLGKVFHRSFTESETHEERRVKKGRNNNNKLA